MKSCRHVALEDVVFPATRSLKSFVSLLCHLLLNPLTSPLLYETPKSDSRNPTAKMPYPEQATGFMIEDQKKWTDFKKQEVRRRSP